MTCDIYTICRQQMADIRHTLAPLLSDTEHLALGRTFNRIAFGLMRPIESDIQSGIDFAHKALTQEGCPSTCVAALEAVRDTLNKRHPSLDRIVASVPQNDNAQIALGRAA